MKCISRSIISPGSVAAWLMLCTQAAAAPPACLVVAGDRILLGDLAAALPTQAVTDRERVVGFAPRPGVRRTLLFREWAGGTRAPLPDEPGEICVERVARTLRRDELTSALEAAFAGAGNTLTVEVEDFPKGAVPVGQLVFPSPNMRLARPDPQSGLVQLIGYVEFGEGALRAQRFPIWVRARIEAESTQVELTCALAPGEEMNPTCAREKVVRAYPFSQGARADASFRTETGSVAALQGRSARRRLPPGTILTEAMFSPRQDVKPRQEINLQVRCGQAHVRLKATSEGGAATGEMVTVRIADSNRRLRVRVIAPGSAELLVPAAPAAGPQQEVKGS